MLNIYNPYVASLPCVSEELQFWLCFQDPVLDWVAIPQLNKLLWFWVAFGILGEASGPVPQY